MTAPEHVEECEIRVAIPEDIPILRDLEVKAAQAFRDVPALASFADDGPSLSIERQQELIAKRTIWVVGLQSSAGEASLSMPVATLAADVVDNSLHIFEVSTLPTYQRRGFAKMLITAAVKHAQDLGLKDLSLTTDRYIAWNGPMYKKRGFEEIAASELGPEHERIVDQEREEGLDVSRRCTMVYYFPQS